MPAPTIRDVAKESGVTISSVSRILRGIDHGFNKQTEQRVREVAQQMGYQAHAAARLLRQQKTRMVGLAVHITTRPYFYELLVAVHGELTRKGYEPVLFEPQQLLPTHSHSPFPSLDMLAGILSLEMSLEHKIPEFYDVVKSRVPTIALYPPAPDNCMDNVDFVFTDLARGVELAVDHLVELGHTRIALAGVSGGIHPSAKLKTQGWRRGLKKHGIELEPEYHLLCDHLDTLPEMSSKIVEGLLALKTAPTALVCQSDETALNIMSNLIRRGWKIPDDLSIVGFDGIECGTYFHPALTTVLQPMESIARVGVERLANCIEKENWPSCLGENPIKPLRKFVEPALVVRDSTGPARKGTVLGG